MPLTLRLFGPFSCRVGGEELPSLRSRRGYLLFALLVLRGGRVVSREGIIALLWPESSLKSGQENLRRTLTDLRRALGAEAWRVVSDGHQSLHFLTDDAVFVDVFRYDALVARWQKTGDADAAAEAVALYDGPLLEGLGHEGILGERMTREEQCGEMLAVLSRQALEDGEATRALALARRAERLDPFNAPTQCLLFEALAGTGDLPAAERAFRQFRARLLREVNQQPDARTQVHIDRLRRAHCSPMPAAIKQSEVEEHSSLPTFLTPFVGREESVKAVIGRLSEVGVRLVTLTGVGGIGKTRLAVEIAREWEGAVFVDLSGLPTGTAEDAISEAVFVALGGTADLSLRETVALLNRANLLVIDNAEHLIPAITRVVAGILSGSGACRILATSRRPLKIPGEVCWTVGPHDEPVALFAARARDARSDFALTDENRAMIAELCRRLDDLPLAIELAAARLRSMPLQKIAGRLSDRFDLLSADAPLAPVRHRTLRGTLEWSHALLQPDEKRLLDSLSVFAGGASLEAIESVAPVSPLPTLDLLSRLIDSSLVVSGERYRLLEAVRDFASEHLRVSGEAEAVVRRHYAYFLGVAREADGYTWGTESSAYFDRLETERENFLRAVQGAGGEEGIHLCLALGNFWYRRGHYRDGIALLTAALDTCTATEAGVDALLMARARDWLGRFRRALGQTSGAEDAFREAVSLCRTADDTALLVDMLNSLGSLCHEQGDMSAAWACYTEGLTLCESIGDQRRAAILQRETGILSNIAGDYAGARERFEAALLTFRKESGRWDETVCLWWLGFACEAQGDFRAASGCFVEALILARELRSRTLELMVLQSQADVSRDRGDFADAQKQYQATLPLAREVGDWYKEAVAWRGMSESARGAGDVTAAGEFSRRAVTLAARSYPSLLIALELLSEAAAVATCEQRETDAVRLYAFVESARGNRGVAIPAATRDRHIRDTMSLRCSLDPVMFDRLWQQGKEMPIENAFLLARA